MGVQAFALTLGIIYAGLGVLGLIPAFVTSPVQAPELAVTALYGFLFALFPVNVLLSLFHLAIGIWGIGAGTTTPGSLSYARSVAVIFGILAVMGLFPVLNTVFGLAPLYGHDIWLHAVTAAVGAYFGWRAAEWPEERRSAIDRRQRTIPVARERRTAVLDRRGGAARPI